MRFTMKQGAGVETPFVRFQYEGADNAEFFAIIATETGVGFTGNSPPLKSIEDLDTFARTVDLAWKAHMRMKGAPHA